MPGNRGQMRGLTSRMKKGTIPMYALPSNVSTVKPRGNVRLDCRGGVAPVQKQQIVPPLVHHRHATRWPGSHG